MRTVNRYTIFKYIVTAALAVFVIAVCIAGIESKKPFEEIASSVELTTASPSLQTADNADLKRLYGLNPSDYEGVLLRTATSGMSAEEILLVKLSDDSQYAAVEAAIRARLEERDNVFKGYAPEQASLVENAKIIRKGKLVFLAVSENADVYAGGFLKSL